METNLCSFMSIFGNEKSDENCKAVIKKIQIPIIQRDFAQGRIDPETTRIRNRFLNSLHSGIIGEPITLDFIYGDIDDNGIMTPLDGQQRLTTLYLLHWYAAKKDKIIFNEYSFLDNFSYETRYSSRDFCAYLLHFEPLFTKKISEQIINQVWFPLDWKKDPTISSMLVMLDSISEVFRDTDNIWMSLRNNAITFHFLPIRDMGLTDELYIKMNSRGKPLTQFEHFKAEFEHKLREIDDSLAMHMIKKIDTNWSELLWQYHDKGHIIDDEFLRYFRFVCDVLCYKSGGTTQGRNFDEFQLIDEYFSIKNKEARSNVLVLEKFFDCWCNIPNEEKPAKFLDNFISHNHKVGRIITDNQSIDIFKDCLKNYADISGNGNRLFPLNKIILLYTFVLYLLNLDTVSEKQFIRRLRIVNNLVKNSDDEISDSIFRASGNRMPSILMQVESIIIFGKIDASLSNNFNSTQINEEIEKISWIEMYPSLSESLFELEDHILLNGQIRIIGLENYTLFSRFHSLFAQDKDLINCALLTIGNYGQKERNSNRYQFGAKTDQKSWKLLFHKSSNEGFETTKSILIKLLSKVEVFSNDYLMKVKLEFLNDREFLKEYDWRYYYVKYDIFRPDSFGKYNWDNLLSKPYEMSVLMTRTNWSENTFQPFLKSIDCVNLSRDYYGQRIIRGEKYIECKNNSFEIRNIDNEELFRTVKISQNQMGVDTEERIMKMIDAISHI